MFTKTLTGARMLWIGCAPSANVRVYYANHNSHGDFALSLSSGIKRWLVLLV